MKCKSFVKLLNGFQLALTLLIALSLPSCRTAKQIAESVPVETKIVERLVPVTVPADSSVFRALFECDSMNQVIMKSMSEDKTSNVASSYSFNAGKLLYKAVAIHDTIYVPVNDTVRTMPVYVKLPVYRQTKMQRFFMWIGVSFIVALIVWLASKLNWKSIIEIIFKLLIK